VSVGPSQVGALDAVTGTGSSLHLLGWAADPDTPAPIVVHVYLDGSFVTAAPADGQRADVAAALPGLGAQHGYDVAVAMPVIGTHDVCVYGINAAGTPGGNDLLACRKVSISS
jgi:hypothetical protein